MSMPVTRTITGRLLAIVLFGVVVPLVLVGVWLTKASERAGRTLLRTQLESGVSRLSQVASSRMAAREGDLQLLANNSAASAVLADSGTADSYAYLTQLAEAVAPAVFAVEYVDATGSVRWPHTSPERTVSTEAPLSAPEPSAVVERRVQRDGRSLGTVRARMRLAAILPLDSAAALVPGGLLQVRDTTGLALWRGGAERGSDDRTDNWESVAGTLPIEGLTFELAAPTTPFTAPFEAAARSGLGVLALVATVAMLLLVVLTRRLAASMRVLSEAAGAVEAGDLTRRVDVEGDDEAALLARAFNRMTESLRNTLLSLSQQRSLAAVGEYAASLSHEVRNGLTAVRVNLQHAGRYLDADNPARPLVLQSLESVRRLDSTVTSALRMARVGHVTRQMVSLGTVVERACTAVQSQFDERGAVLHPPRLLAAPRLEADAPSIEQLLVNLLLNAAQALPPGGEANVELSEHNDEVLVRVRDSGEGIGEEIRQRLGHPLTTTKRDGTGLGLPIARRLAEAHGGRIDIESEPGDGTVVTLVLPKQPG